MEKASCDPKTLFPLPRFTLKHPVVCATLRLWLSACASLLTNTWGVLLLALQWRLLDGTLCGGPWPSLLQSGSPSRTIFPPPGVVRAEHSFTTTTAFTLKARPPTLALSHSLNLSVKAGRLGEGVLLHLPRPSASTRFTLALVVPGFFVRPFVSSNLFIINRQKVSMLVSQVTKYILMVN